MSAAMKQQANENVIRKTVRVKASQQIAFQVFTQKMTAWWPGQNHLGKVELKEALLEGRAGGRWFERGVDGTECDWGKVLAWEPPQRVLLDWQIDAQWKFDPAFHTEVEVRFIAEGPKQTRVELEHRNLERFGTAKDALKAALAGEGGWGGIMELYAQVTAREA